MNTSPSQQIEVGILGATGTVGQQFIRLLENHPWFRLAWLAASGRSEGRAYREATAWRLTSPLPAGIGEQRVEACVPGRGPKLVFSGLDANAAQEIEPAFAAAGHMRRQQRAYLRMDPRVPLVIPKSMAIISRSSRTSNASGAVRRRRDESHCSTVVLSMVLAALVPLTFRA